MTVGPNAQMMKLIDLITMAWPLLFHTAVAQIAGGDDMGNVVPLPYHVAFAVLCLSILWTIYAHMQNNQRDPWP
jgi:hypothetical protein